MTGILAYVPIINRLVASDSKSRAINVPPVEVHNIETSTDKRARSLKYLIKANHVNHSVVYNKLRFDNHVPHALCSAYLLGADENLLNAIYEEESRALEPWVPSPAEIYYHNWREQLGDTRYQRSYVDFFEDQLVNRFSYDWKKVADHFMFGGEKPLYHGLIGGLGHPLIHLGYAYEMDSKEVGIEALTLTCVQYNFFHEYLDRKIYTRPSKLTPDTPLNLLIKMSEDKRFDGIKNPSYANLEAIFMEHEELILDYWNAWVTDDPLRQFELSQQAAVAVSIQTAGPTYAYDFFLIHLLTTSHAVRTLLPFFPSEHHIPLVRAWWLLAIAVSIVRGRPRPDSHSLDTSGREHDWSWVIKHALLSPYAKDAHYVKAIRSIQAAACTWGDDDGSYLAAAEAFATRFHGWTF